MTQPHKYNELGQFISEGGIVAAGILAFRGESADKIRQFISRRVPALSEMEFVRIYRDIVAGKNAASYMRQLDDLEQADPSQIPIVPQLFGDNPEGRRLIIAVLAQREDMDRPWEVRIEQEDFWTRDRLAQVLEGILAEWREKYPGLFENMGPKKIRKMAIQEMWTARRF